MQNNKISIRGAIQEDCNAIFEWRNDSNSRDMFYEGDAVTFENHLSWFSQSLVNPDRQLFIGELNGKKIGVTRFDFNKDSFKVEVSINMNPLMRGKGLGKRLLAETVEKYLAANEFVLTARIKQKNSASKKIFRCAGFIPVLEDDEVVYLERLVSEVRFKEVDLNDIDILFEFLKYRVHSISHSSLPSFNEHKRFMEGCPYEHWLLIYQSDIPIGTFYVQSDNSVGVNLLSHNKKIMIELINYIKDNFSPKEEVKSKIPPYFFINVAESNLSLASILKELSCSPIQTSYKLE